MRWSSPQADSYRKGLVPITFTFSVLTAERSVLRAKRAVTARAWAAAR